MYIAAALSTVVCLSVQQFHMVYSHFDPDKCGTPKQPSKTDPFALQAPWECWDYFTRGPLSWDVFYPTCGLNHQSPIDIYPEMAVPKPDLPELQFRNFNQFVTAFQVANLRAGTLVLELDPGYNLSVSLDESWTTSFQLKQIQLKWGNTDQEGSEHRIGSRAYPLEIQFIHVDDSQKWKGSGRPSDNYLTALSVFAQPRSCYSDSKSFLSLLGQIRIPKQDESDDTEDSDTLLPKGFYPIDLLPRPSRQGRYLRYNGSLTHPPCTEAVNWIVFSDPIHISHCALNYLRSLDVKDGNLQMTPSFRILQPVNDRTVHFRDVSGPKLPELTELRRCGCQGSYDELVFANGCQVARPIQFLCSYVLPLLVTLLISRHSVNR